MKLRYKDASRDKETRDAVLGEMNGDEEGEGRGGEG